MKVTNACVWALTPIILLVGFYFAVADVPEEPVRTQTPPMEILKDPIAREGQRELGPIEESTAQTPIQDYWDYTDLWEGKKRGLTSLAYENWIVSQAGVRVSVKGRVYDIDKLGYKDPERCTLGLQEVTGPLSISDYHAEILICERVAHLNKGDDVTLHCVIDGSTRLFGGPSTKDCEIQ